MVDRAPTKPNRYAVYDENHNFIRYEYHERADEPTQEGDALNKANLLPDAVATALGLTGNPQVKDALEKLFDIANPKAKIATGSYTGNLSYPRNINLGFQPDFVLVETITGGGGPKGSYSAVWATPDAPAGKWDNGSINNQYDSVAITSTGITVTVGTQGTTNRSYTRFNQTGKVYRYIALKNPL